MPQPPTRATSPGGPAPLPSSLPPLPPPRGNKLLLALSAAALLVWLVFLAFLAFRTGSR